MTQRASLPPLSPTATDHIKGVMRERESNLVYGVCPSEPEKPKPRWITFAYVTVLAFIALELVVILATAE